MIYPFITSESLAEAKSKVVEALFLFDKMYACQTDKELFPTRQYLVDNFHFQKRFENSSTFFWNTVDILAFYNDLLSYAEHADTARILNFSNPQRPTNSEISSLLVITRSSGFLTESALASFSKNLGSQRPRVLCTGFIAPSEESAKNTFIFINNMLEENKFISDNTAAESIA